MSHGISHGHQPSINVSSQPRTVDSLVNPNSNDNSSLLTGNSIGSIQDQGIKDLLTTGNFDNAKCLGLDVAHIDNA